MPEPGAPTAPLGIPPTPLPPPVNQRLPLGWDDVSIEVQKDIEARVAALPALPTMTTSLVALLQDPSSHPKDVAKVAATDPAVATEILRAVNSAYFALRQPVNDLSRAILLLGYNWVKFMVLRLGMMRTATKDKDLKNRLSALWHHSFMTSECVSLVLRYYSRVQPAEASTAALLHDLGRLVKLDLPGSEVGVATGMMLESNGIPIEERVYLEEDIFGVNHCLVGGVMADHLLLPPLVKIAQTYHHHPLNAIANLPFEDNTLRVIVAVKLGDVLAHAYMDKRSPEPETMRGMAQVQPDLTPFGLFFPNLPDFSTLMGFLEPELHKSASFLDAYVVKPDPDMRVRLDPIEERYAQSTGAQKTTGVQVRTSVGPPAGGSHQVGDIFYNENPVAGAYVGWVCVEAGSPGLWNAFGRIHADQVDQHPSAGGRAPRAATEVVAHPEPRVAPAPVTSAPAAKPPSPQPSQVPPPVPRSAQAPQPAALQAQRHQAVRSPQRPHPGPQRPSSDPDETYRPLFTSYLEAKQQNGESTERLTYRNFARSIEKRKTALEASGDKLEFRVVVKNERVALVARRLRGRPVEHAQ